MGKDVMVSVICNAYNHEKYIRDALEGFVMQKTNFAFEVLVHDDASTDKTADIIREYETKYPDLIKPIYQTENQYSKGVAIGHAFQFPRVLGKYIAVCEGDDYWTDPCKLQKQFDAMEAHPEIDMCAHAAQHEVAGNLTSYVMPSESDCIFTPEEVIIGWGDFVATASLFYKSDLNNRILPFRNILRLDYTLQISGSLSGGMLYLADCMCVYRLATESSWTNIMRKNTDRYIKHYRKLINSLEQLDIDTEHKYHGAVSFALAQAYETLLYTMYCHKVKFDDKYKALFKSVPLKRKMKLRIRYYLHISKMCLKKLIKR